MLGSDPRSCVFWGAVLTGALGMHVYSGFSHSVKQVELKHLNFWGGIWLHWRIEWAHQGGLPHPMEHRRRCIHVLLPMTAYSVILGTKSNWCILSSRLRWCKEGNYQEQFEEEGGEQNHSGWRRCLQQGLWSITVSKRILHIWHQDSDERDGHCPVEGDEGRVEECFPLSSVGEHWEDGRALCPFQGNEVRTREVGDSNDCNEGIGGLTQLLTTTLVMTASGQFQSQWLEQHRVSWWNWKSRFKLSVCLFSKMEIKL